MSYTKADREFLASLELERRTRSEKEQEFREGKRITYEEGMKLYFQQSAEEALRKMKIF